MALDFAYYLEAELILHYIPLPHTYYTAPKAMVNHIVLLKNLLGDNKMDYI